MNPLKGVKISLLLIIGLFVNASISFASGLVSTSISAGPQDYIESRSSVYLSISDYLKFGTKATFFDKRDSDLSQVYLLEAIISPDKAIGFNAGLTFSPPSNNMKSSSLFGGISYMLYRADADLSGESSYSTTIGVSGEVKDIYLKINTSAQWRKLDQNSIGLSLNQTFLKDYFFALNYVTYMYGHDEAIGRNIRDRILRGFMELRFTTGLPSNTFSASLGAYLLNRLTLDLTYSKTAFKLNQPIESSYAIGLDYSLFQNIGMNLEYALYSYADQNDSYYTGGITYYF